MKLGLLLVLLIMFCGSSLQAESGKLRVRKVGVEAIEEIKKLFATPISYEHCTVAYDDDYALGKIVKVDGSKYVRGGLHGIGIDPKGDSSVAVSMKDGVIEIHAKRSIQMRGDMSYINKVRHRTLHAEIDEHTNEIISLDLYDQFENTGALHRLFKIIKGSKLKKQSVIDCG